MSESTGVPRSGLVGTSAVLAVGLGVAQVLAYALNVAGARVLGPAEYGELGALLSLIVIGNVAALALQATTARRVSLGTDPTGLGPTALAAAGAVTLVALLSVPVLAALLRLEVVALVAVALALLPLTLTGWTLGAAQGAMRFGTLAAMYALGAGLRIGAALGALLLWETVTATAVATCAGTAAGWVVTQRLAGLPWPGPRRPGRAAVAEATHAGAALLAMFTLTSVDVLAARALLPPDVAGQYAAGAILIKIAFWLPQAVVVAAFPRLSSGEAGVLRRATLLMVGVGATGVALASVLGPAVVPAVLGQEYTAASSSAGLFVAAGVVQSLAYLVVYDRLAAEDRGAALLVWGAVALLLLLAAAFGGSSAVALAWCVVGASAALVVAGAVLRRQRGRVNI